MITRRLIMNKATMTTQATLHVHLAALVRNYQLLRARHQHQRCAGVVKANAYGLGVLPVAHALVQAGCPVLFVATLEEALEVRAALPETPLYVLQGVLAGQESVFLEHGLRPVLNSMPQIMRWQQALAATSAFLREQARAALHVDTGMCRLGLDVEELAAIDNHGAFARACHLDVLMTHLACASDAQHPLNLQQLTAFDVARAYFPQIPTSIANSSGHFLDVGFHGDLGRPGCALYGITPHDALPNPMEAVVRLTAPILRIRTIGHEQPIGYGATRTAQVGQKVAVVAMGYADGLHRIASNQLSVWIGEYEAPMLGRVSMDMTCYDVSHIPDSVLDASTDVEIIGAHQTVDDVARVCQTIGYEILTSLGRRVKRVYHP